MALDDSRPANPSALSTRGSRRRCLARIGLAFLLFFGSTGAPTQAIAGGTLLERLLQMEADHAALCKSLLAPDMVRELLRDAADEFRRTSSEPHTQPQSPSAEAVVNSLNHLVFERLGVRPSQDLRDPCNLLLSSVLARRQGYCVGIAAVYLTLAEDLHLPIYGVATPSHVFLRFDDGTTRINIETSQSGAAVSDDRYIAEQKIAPRSLRKGIFLRDLTEDEFIAQVYNNLGVVYSERKEYGAAASEYERAIVLCPRFPAAFYNYSNDLLQQGQAREAIRLYTKSLRLSPLDAWALNNRGLAYVKTGKQEKARQDFKEALEIESAFEQAKRNLEGLPPP